MKFWGKKTKLISLLMIIISALATLGFGVMFIVGANYKANVMFGLDGTETYSTLNEIPRSLYYGVGLFNYGNIYIDGREIDINELSNFDTDAQQLKLGPYRSFLRYWNNKFDSEWFNDKKFYGNNYEISREFCSLPQRAHDMCVAGAILSTFFLIITIISIVIYITNKKKMKEHDNTN